ncbi:Rec8 like protein-domain-containing protein [Lophiotrema nucula]|uniref:Rec8 like protein-domain-containing protein n=1 Tax=Lophiotrema nucula TaxID=690887 RepID=A0A6A5Z729_9PLEO|nr:Rec8 like protein-domain-containing protein [Lophiotrema nucula]
MFYSPHILVRTGALSRVWLAANYEKKLNKNQVLQDKITDDIDVIINPEKIGGPLALRLSGQLLLGVVRIYNRKARYLADDCQEALQKIRMVFRPGNIDLPSNQSHLANPNNLVLPDVITEIDLLQPMPDLEKLLGGSLNLDNIGNISGLEDPTVPDWDNSQFLSGSIEQARAEVLPLDDDFMIDMGDDVDLTGRVADDSMSIEVGRNAPLERRMSDEIASSPKLLPEDDLEIDFGEDIDTTLQPAPEVNVDVDVDVDMGGMTDLGGPVDEATPTAEQRESPLSSTRNSVIRDFEQQEGETTNFEPEEEEESVHQARQVKRRKVIHADADTELQMNQIREMQNDRSKILKPASFLPRDPMLLALMNMQKTGGFVSSILGDGRSRGWAPELRGILSLEVVSRPAHKRKRDSGVADLETEEEDAAASAEKTPQLEIDEADLEAGAGLGGLGDESGLGRSSVHFDLPGDDDIPHVLDIEEEDYEAGQTFDETTVPLVHPADSGPVSLVTKRAVHLLREQFGADAEHSESERQKSSVLFQDMFPENTTTKKDATTMFFEMLVLATKDAIKVEQPVEELGGPLRVRAKRGLWGAWAEEGASVEEASPAPAVAVEA